MSADSVPLVDVLKTLWRDRDRLKKEFDAKHPDGCTLKLPDGRKVYVPNARHETLPDGRPGIYIGPEEIDDAEYDAIQYHPIDDLIEQIHRLIGIEKGTIEQVARRIGTPFGCGGYTLLNGTQDPDLTWVLPKLHDLDRDGFTDRWVSEFTAKSPEQAQRMKLFSAGSRLGAAMKPQEHPAVLPTSKLPKLNATDRAALDYIHTHPGMPGDTIARQVGRTVGHFRGRIVPKLKAHGVTNDGTDGYYCPDPTA